MIIKGIGATTHIDRHNCRMSKEVLEKIAKDINENEYAIGVGIEHDSTVMPIGKVICGEIIDLADGEYALEIEQELFEDYQVLTDESNMKWYISESSDDIRPFADSKPEVIKNMKIAVDPVNFSGSDFDDLLVFYKEECDLDTESLVRKSFIPEPEIIFTLIQGTLAIMIGKKTVEKIADNISADIVKIYDLIKKAVIKTVKRLKSDNRPVTYIVKENDEYLMELVVVTEKPDILFEALSIDKISEVHTEIEKFINCFNFDIAKLQCMYDVEKQKWEVNYVSTKDGKIIGSEKCYKKTVELAERVRTGLSVGITQNIDDLD